MMFIGFCSILCDVVPDLSFNSDAISCHLHHVIYKLQVVSRYKLFSTFDNINNWTMLMMLAAIKKDSSKWTKLFHHQSTSPEMILVSLFQDLSYKLISISRILLSRPLEVKRTKWYVAFSRRHPWKEMNYLVSEYLKQGRS